jgi:hypothetical protein
VVGVLSLDACASEPDPTESEGFWVGTISTAGNVTTVVNESGSMWGGNATLVEEASIGVAAGADEYMFGQVDSVYADQDQIYVVDRQVPAVRVYDHDGAFVRDLGAKGQGPGEYRIPVIVAAGEDGRVFVVDMSALRINVYDATGKSADTWPLPSYLCCVWPIYPLTHEAVWAPVRQGSDLATARLGAQAVGPDGPYGEVTWVPELDYDRATYDNGTDREGTAPFSPYRTWEPAPNGRLLVGASDTYRFEVHDPDGSKLIIERFWDPVPVPTQHREWERQFRIASQRRFVPDFTWDGAEIPDHKAAYVALIGALSGETWVVRQGASVRLAHCADDPNEDGFQAAYERPCWDDEKIVDVFGPDGRYLGGVDLPDGVNPSATTFFIDGRRIVTVVTDNNGVARVKRYRLVPPGEEQ